MITERSEKIKPDRQHVRMLICSIETGGRRALFVLFFFQVVPVANPDRNGEATESKTTILRALGAHSSSLSGQCMHERRQHQHDRLALRPPRRPERITNER